MTDREFAEILAIGYERPGTEFKGSGPLSNKHLRAKVARAALGMSNRRDGGLIIVGVEEVGWDTKPAGLSAKDLVTWKFDKVADALAEYSDPNIEFDLEVRQHEGRKFVVIRVHEFSDIPILCNKDYPGVLRKGACYVRSRRKPETAEIPSQEDMRDLLDLAAEKRLRKFIAQARAGGLEIAVTSSAPGKPSDQELFKKQIKDLL